MKNQHYYYLTLLNLGTLCISTSGPLGRFIPLPPPLIIWSRALVAFLVLGAYCLWKKERIKKEFIKNSTTLLWSGTLLTLHWVTYFFALQWSGVAIGMLSLFTFPILTVFLEPLFFKTKLHPIHLIFGVFILIGIYLLVPAFDFESEQSKGLLMGLFSALTYALRNLILKKRIKKINGSLLMFYQLGTTLLLLFPVLMLYPLDSFSPQIPYLMFLGLVTTALGHTLFLNSLTYFTVSTASIMNSIQPIFGILIAFFFLNEIPPASSLIGGGMILTTVVIESLRSRRA
ncbi:MAG: EamA family transporter [Flavobacteriaceae bacterium]|nr:EamA family transporter [Flavobacteriaceae bacterium]MDG1911963.1 EamA family transporter [Flavobacteriaceae bacterium]